LQRAALSPVVAPLARRAQGPVAAIGYTEPSLVYYSGRSWDFQPETREGLDRALALKPQMLLIERRHADFNTLLAFDDEVSGESEVAIAAEELLDAGWIRYSAEGLNIAKPSWVWVDVYIRPEGAAALPDETVEL
jgi:hypothetical protein